MGKWLDRFSADNQESLPDIPDIVPSVSGLSGSDLKESAKIETLPGVGHHVVVEPAATHARQVYWETNDGRIRGPALPEFLAQVGTGEAARFLVLVQHEGQFRFVDSDRLRSSQAHAIRQKLYAACRPRNHDWRTIYFHEACFF